MRRRVCVTALAVALAVALRFPAAAMLGGGTVGEYPYQLVDTSRDGRFSMYYDLFGWYVLDADTGKQTLLALAKTGENYVFWGDRIAKLYSDGRVAKERLLDPDGGYYATPDFELPAPAGETERYRVRSMAWHEASARLVCLLTSTDEESDAMGMHLGIYSEDGALERCVRLPFAVSRTHQHDPLKDAFTQVGMWGDYAVFYDFSLDPEHKENERIVFYHIDDDTYWFGQGDRFVSIKDRLLILDNAVDAAGNPYLQVELYVPGQPVKTYWLEGLNTQHLATYNYVTNRLHTGSYILDFETGELSLIDWSLTADPHVRQ